MKRNIALIVFCFAVTIGSLYAAVIDEDIYGWTGWSARTDISGYIGSGFKSAQAPGENPVSTNITGLAADTDYVVWIRAYAKVGAIRAVRSVVTANAGTNKLGRFITHERGFSANGWYWQKAGVIHTPVAVTSVTYSIYQAYNVADWKHADQVRLSDDLSYEPAETILNESAAIFIDCYYMNGGWGSQTYNPYSATSYIGKGNISGKSPGPATYDNLGGFQTNTEYAVWVRAGLNDDGKKRSIKTTVSDVGGELLSVVSHDGSFAAGELDPYGGPAWYWEKLGTFINGANTVLNFKIEVAAGHDPTAYKCVDTILLTADTASLPLYKSEYIIPVAGTVIIIK